MDEYVFTSTTVWLNKPVTIGRIELFRSARALPDKIPTVKLGGKTAGEQEKTAMAFWSQRRHSRPNFVRLAGGAVGEDEMKGDDASETFADPAEAIQQVNKITWAMAGRVADPGRYMFKFGWLTITANDLAVWQAYPNAAFTVIRTLTSRPAKTDERPVGEEFCLGTFELRTGSNYSDGEK